MKRFFTWTLPAFLILLSIPLTSAAYDFEVDGIYYDKLGNGVSVAVTYKDSSYHSYTGSVTIPSQVTYSGTTYTVTKIGAYAFQGSGLTSVTIPNSVTSIYTYAFCGCCSLTSVTIPNSVTLIDWCAFYGCTGLTSVTIPNSVTEIGKSAFMDCTSLTSVTIPNSVTEIGKSAFYGCTGLIKSAYPDNLSNPFSSGVVIAYPSDGVADPDGTIYNADKSVLYYAPLDITALDIPGTVITIRNKSFSKCSKLTSLTIPASVTSIWSNSFDGCTGLTSVTYNAKNCAIALDWFSDAKSITKFEIGPEVRSIPNYLCRGMSNLTSITIPNSVTSIGHCAFEDCSGLTSVTIPNSVTSIGDGAFLNCHGLTKVIITDITAWCNIEFLDHSANPLYYAHHLYLGNTEITDLVIPNSITSIGSWAFASCSGLTTVTIPNSVTSIGNYAFEVCSGLTSVVVPNSVTSIRYNAFHGCKNAKIKAFPQPYSQLKDGWSSYNGTLVLVGGRLYDYSNVGIHQESIDFVIKSIDYEPAPEGYESVDAYEGGIYYNSEYYQINSGETITFNNLYPNSKYTFKCYTKYSNGETIFFDERKLTTKNLGVKVTNVYSATTVSALCSYQMDDAVFDRESITFNGKTIEGHKLFVTGLKPNTSYKASYTVYTKGGSSETKEFNFKTPALELTILKPNSVSSTCSIVAAETNMSDDETSAGFQWKKYDAPSTLEPNEAYAAIYDGRLEGYIKNLQSTSYYNVRAFYKASDGTYYYSDWKTFDPSDFSYFEPTVHTYPTSEVTSNSATVKGYVLPGSDEITSQGIEYWAVGSAATPMKVISPMAVNNEVNTIFASGQVMLVTLSDLQQATTYSYRAFVTTQAGTTYGEEQTFTTEGEAGIGSIGADSPEREVICYYDLSGRRYEEPQRGLNIVVYSDGSTEKMIIKQ